MLEWNVYTYNINAKKMERYNIFNHGGFIRELKKIFQETSKEKRVMEIGKCLRYYFWSKAEWEIIISPWIGEDKAKEKIDVYYQIYMNFDKFIDYTEAHQNEIIEKAQEIEKYYK